MTTTQKSFDCIRMKDEIQARLHKRRAGMSAEEIAADIRQGVMNSPAPIAKLWRQLSGESAEPARKRPDRTP